MSADKSVDTMACVIIVTIGLVVLCLGAVCAWTSSRMQMMVGNTFANVGAYAKAEIIYQRAVDRCPSNEYARMNLAWVLNAQGKWILAQREIAAAEDVATVRESIWLDAIRNMRAVMGAQHPQSGTPKEE